jgi:hypothetical protein
MVLCDPLLKNRVVIVVRHIAVVRNIAYTSIRLLILYGVPIVNI